MVHVVVIEAIVFLHPLLRVDGPEKHAALFGLPRLRFAAAATTRDTQLSKVAARLDLHGALFFPTWTRLAAHTPGAALATAAPSSRNKVLYLQDCVNWEAGQEVLVTTTHHKDTRGYHKNEQRTIAQGGVRCVKVDGREYGQVTLTVALAHYHHAGSREYQAEVALLSRNIVIRGNARSDPTDTTPLECDAATTYTLGDVDRFTQAYDKIPCQNTYVDVDISMAAITRSIKSRWRASRINETSFAARTTRPHAAYVWRTQRNQEAAPLLLNVIALSVY